MKTGLVFSGGGSRGAYQVGVWKALEKLNIKCDVVTGTSIGSINAALYVQGDLKQAETLWKSISFKSVFSEEFDYNSPKDKFRVKLKYLKAVRKGGIEPNNLRQNLLGNIDINKFYNSNINYGLITVTYPKLRVVEKVKSKIKKEELIDYLIASSTVFPMFKVKEIDNRKYIDGGFRESIPINLAIKLGADKIIAIDISYIGRGKRKYKNMDMTVIKPNNDVGRCLTFDGNIARRNIRYGYNDTMKVFDKLYGKKYTLKDIDKTFLEYKYFNTENRIISSIEYLASLFEIDDSEIYNFDELNKLILESFSRVKLRRKIDPKNIIGLKERIRSIYSLIKNKNKELPRIEKLFVKEYKAAYYLYILINKKS